MSMLLLYNPRCSTCRKGRQWLEERGVPFEMRDYLQEPLSLDELRILRQKLGLPPERWLRWKEPEAQDLGLDPGDPPMALLEAMSRHPRLIERPILVAGDRAVVGRPGPEAWQDVVP